MIDLYEFPTPNAWKVSIMLEECGLPYQVKLIDIVGQGQYAPEFLKINPNNKIPAIVDHDPPWGGTQTVFESGAILIYLADKAGKFLAPSGPKRLEALQWTFWQAAGLGPMCGQANHFRNYHSENTYGVERYTKEAARLYGVLDRRLEGRDWIADDYGIADMMCWGWVWFHQMHGQNLDDFPNVKRWYFEMSKRPAVSRGKAATVELASDSMKAMYSGPYWSPQPLDPALVKARSGNTKA